nr:MAG TPA: Thymidylate synthase complementing protein [Bacteriophage sp.]
MKLIKQSFQLVDQKGFTLRDIYKHIEYCARISYKSQEKITDTSYKKFVIMLKSRGHDRPLEFGTVHLKMSSPQFDALQMLLIKNKVYNDCWIKYNVIDTEKESICYITTNYRYYMELCRYDRGVSEYLDPSDNPLYPRRYTVHMILDRGVMDEFRTHVGLSHLAESTRYCNYSKDKFNNEVTFVIPSWCNSLIEGSKQEYSPFEINGDEVEFMNALQNAQNSYLSLLKMGWTPQQARSVLPLGIKSELISCGFEDAWKNFFYRRDAPDAHPMAQEIAKPIHKEFIERGFIDK